MGSEIHENDLLNQAATNLSSKELPTVHPLHALQQAIANMPDIDTEKVQAAINKIRNGSLDILGDEDQQLACANRIAQQIIDESR